jgi:hypothetical protein
MRTTTIELFEVREGLAVSLGDVRSISHSLKIEGYIKEGLVINGKYYQGCTLEDYRKLRDAVQKWQWEIKSAGTDSREAPDSKEAEKGQN